MARVLAGLAALLTALCLASAAWAHATLVSAEPADGSVLTLPPKMVQLHFNESVTPAVVGLIDAAGKARDVATRAVGQSVLMVLPDDLPQGTQIVSYRVVSEDGHPVAGSLVFSIGAVTGSAPPAECQGVDGADLAGADRGLSRAVRGRRRRILRELDRAGTCRIGGEPRRTRHRARQRICFSRPAGPRSAQPSLRRHRDIGAMGERAGHQPRAFAVDRNRRDGDGVVRVEKPEQDGCPGADDASNDRRRGFAGDQRPCRDRGAAMAHAPVVVPARRCGRLLDRRVGAAGGHGAPAG